MASPFSGMSSVSCPDGESGSSPSSISSMATISENVTHMILNDHRRSSIFYDTFSSLYLKTL